MYEQKMCYIDLYKNGVKCGNMGHVRMEWDENRYRFGVNLCHMDRQTLVTAVLERSGGRPRTTIQNIAIIHGRGSAQFDWMPLEGDEERLLFQASGEIYGICLLPKMREMPKEAGEERAEKEMPGHPEALTETVSQTAKMHGEKLKAEPQVEEKRGEKPETEPQVEKKRGEKPETELQVEKRRGEKPETELRAAEKLGEKSEADLRLTLKADGGQDAERETASRTIEKQEERTQEQKGPGEVKEEEVLTYPQGMKGRRQRERYMTSLSDDKWKQLCSIYPIVHPIGDDVDFIQITPVDFVVLRQEYQNLVRNSFLLHGYYNYDHVLLGKYPDKYYIGVPGIMHEQERIAAAMFGFVGFEHAEAPKNQKENRDRFGYYMMEVGI